MKLFVFVCLLHSVVTVSDDLNELLKGQDKQSIIGLLKQIKNSVVKYENLPLCFYGNNSSTFKMRTDPLVIGQLQQITSDTKQKLDLIIDNINIVKLLSTSHSSQLNDLRLRIQKLEFGHTAEKTVEPIPSYMTMDTISAPDSSSVLYMVPYNDTKDEPIFEQHLKEAVQKLTKEIATLNIDLASQSVQLEKLQNNDQCPCPVDNLQDILQAIKNELAVFEAAKAEIEQEKKTLLEVTNKLKGLELSVGEDPLKTQLDALKAENQKMANAIESLTHQNNLLTQEMKAMNETIIHDHKSGNIHRGDTAKKLCVWPYKRAGGSCYHVVTNERLTWVQARQKCQEIQGDLATPHNIDGFIAFLLTLRLSRSYSYWLGASDAVIESTWKWLDGSLVDQVVWASGKPRGDESSNCMEILPSLKFAASDIGCTQRRQFVCEQE